MEINIKDEYSLDYKILKSKIIYNTYAYYEIMNAFSYPAFIHNTSWSEGYKTIYNKQNISFQEKVNIINDLIFLIAEEETEDLFNEKINCNGKEMYGICLSKSVLNNLLYKDNYIIDVDHFEEPEITKKNVNVRER